uniref:Ig-like domain-containing protein n=1 Tax=Amphiprion ocellaris TaxID=80972 RepID=A0A3Q1BBK9_AMPOC
CSNSPENLFPTDKPKAVLSVSPSWLSPGTSVTLSCEVEHSSAGWRFYWYKAVPDLSGTSYSYELLPGSINGTEQDSYIIHGKTQTAGFTCRAGRGDPEYYSDYSDPKFVWSGDFHPAASLTVNPDTVQHFSSTSVSLSCEGNSTKWRVIGSINNVFMLQCSILGTMNGSTCNVDRILPVDIVYWCESGSAFSNAVNITGHIILVSPVHPVTEGDSVTLGCKLRTQNVLSNVFFYKDDKLIQNDSRGEMSISAVSESDEGFYKCQYSGKESPQSWMAVKSSSSEKSSFPVLLITGLVCGVLLILILLFLLMCCCRKIKGEMFYIQ